MNLLALRAEVKDRGFDYLPDSRIDRWINRGYQRICDREAWDFLEATATGAAPLTISDFRSAYSVIETNNDRVLQFADVRTVRELDPNLDSDSAPEAWYYDAGQIKVFPAGNANLNVLYIKHPAELSADSDEPELPDRYHPLLVDAAVCEAYKDTDNFEAFGILRQDVEEQVAEMVIALGVRNFDTPRSLDVSWGSSTDW